MKNDCIKIGYVYGDETTGIEPYKGSISANSDEKNCFDPVLKGSAASAFASASAAASGYTATDVLQILKTKIGLLFWPRKEICIVDIATKGDVAISPFKMIRGGDAIYEKYGYTSDFITEVKGIIRQQMVQSYLVTRYLKTELEKFMQFIYAIKGIPVTSIEAGNTMRLTELMNRYTLEDEQAYYNYQILESSEKTSNGVISDWLVYNIGKYREWTRSHSPTAALPVSDFMTVPVIGGPTAWNFCLDPANPRWQASAARLMLLGFDARPLASEGSYERRGRRARRTRRTRRYRKRH